MHIFNRHRENVGDIMPKLSSSYEIFDNEIHIIKYKQYSATNIQFKA